MVHLRRWPNIWTKFVVLGIFVILLLNIGTQYTDKKKITESFITKIRETLDFPDSLKLPPFIIIVCSDSNSTDINSSFDRQMTQVTVLLKSAATLTKEILRFVVVTNSKEIYEKVNDVPSSWPEEYRNRLIMEHREVWYPPDRENMRAYLRPCSSARLFLPETMKDLDAAVLVDTDILFLRPPEDLLKEIFKFDDKQAAGIAHTSGGYIDRNHPYPEPGGVNTGVMIMNFTRLRNLPGGWTGTTLRVFDEYRTKLKATVTNDIVNIAMALNPDLLYHLNCAWNYNPGVCLTMTNTCKESIDITGVYLIQGIGSIFFNSNQMKIRAVFEAWKHYVIGTPLADLLSSIRQRIDADTSPIKGCNTYNLKFLFTESLRNIIG